VPTLVVRGGLSDVVSEEGVREFLEHAPHSEYVNVDRASHMVAGDRNDAFSDAVVDFLARTVPVAP
jgi:non-heme chloroperoxidase